ncbi:MAG: hypothetical protein A3H94_00690 [Acidobacteria bacterium RIFCSPLOWO2_02_FULL_60_20]|nr:MAG: hypothetical protein A3H94_00690 [Acidobacteria bacterium RIFCSPLOWO2_02_FULL_60_20]
MNTSPTKPPLPEDECVGEVTKELHLSRYGLLISYDQEIVQELSNVFAKSSWSSEYGTDYCLADQLDCELEEMLDEDKGSSSAFIRLLRLIINQAKYEDCENVILSH